MDIVAAVLLLLFTACVTLGVVVTVKTVKAVKRGVERTSLQARRMVEDTTLKARGYTHGGVAGDLARLRLDLRTSIDSTYRVLEAGSQADASLAEALGLLNRLNEHARLLDGELKLLEREPHKGRIADRLPALTERTGRIMHSADSLRWAAQDRARRLADDELSALGRQIDIEAGALRHWTPATPPAGCASPGTGSMGDGASAGAASVGAGGALGLGSAGGARAVDAGDSRARGSIGGDAAAARDVVGGDLRKRIIRS